MKNTENTDEKQTTELHEVGCCDLLACPFCGVSNTEIVHCEEGCCGAKPRLVACVCGAELNGEWKNDLETVKAWNNRPREWKETDEHVCDLNRDMTGKCFICGNRTIFIS